MDIRYFDNAATTRIKEEVLEDLFEEKYETEDKDFEDLITTYTTYRDDTPLKELVKKIHGYIYSNPFPQKWLHEKIEMFNLEEQGLLEQDFSKTLWGAELLKDLEEETKNDITILEDVAETLQNDRDLESFYKIIESDINQIKTLQKSLDNWDKAYETSG